MKFIIYCGSGIGDFFIISPLVMSLKHSYPSCQIDLLINANKKNIESKRKILLFQSSVKNIFYYTRKEFIHDVFLLKRLRLNKYDYGFSCLDDYMNASIFPSKIFKIIKTRSVGCVSRNRKIIYDIYSPISDGPRVNKSFFCYSLAKCSLGIDLFFDTSFFDMEKLNSYYSKKIKIPSKYIVLALGAGPVTQKTGNKIEMLFGGHTVSNNPKGWLNSYWNILIADLISYGYNIVLIGGKEEAKAFKLANFTSTSSKAINYLGCLDINESFFVIQNSSFVVGADTGMMQAAGIFGKKTVSIFGCTSSIEYHPYGPNIAIQSSLPCSPCFRSKDSIECKTKACMKSITPETVLLKIVNSLKENA